MATDDRVLREQLVEFLRLGSAHADIEAAFHKFSPEFYGAKSKGASHSAWQLLEHMRFTVHDLLDFSTNAEYVAPKWPEDYWPGSEAPADKAEWDASVKALQEDMAAFEKLVDNPRSNLYARIPWGEGQTLLREVLLAGDHTSYHLGQLVALRKELGAWEG